MCGIQLWIWNDDFCSEMLSSSINITVVAANNIDINTAIQEHSGAIGSEALSNTVIFFLVA